MTPATHTLTLAHSADADDVFMWWPLTGKVDPAQPSRILSPAVLDTGPLRFAAVPEDIQALNRLALEYAHDCAIMSASTRQQRARSAPGLDITAVSMHTYPRIATVYALTACGWSMGEGFGPKVVVRSADHPPGTPLAPPGSHLRGKRIAVPGLDTTAHLILSLMLGSTAANPSFVAVPMRFDTIAAAVSNGEVDAGVLIHESQIDFERLGLRALADLGAWWQAETSGPLPLGANVVRRDLDTRLGAGTLARVGALLQQSIRHALAHRTESLAYARTFSPPISDADLDRYVSMYVSPLTVDPRPRGVAAVQEMFSRAAKAGLGVDPGELDLI